MPEDGARKLVLQHIFLAILELGLPVAVLAWWLFYQLYSRGELARDADRKALRLGLREIRKATKKSGGAGVGILQKKWMKFGGGFYGLAALWTLIVMEITGVVGTAMNPSSLMASLDKGIFNFVVDLLVNQFLTFVAALTWFTYWNSHDDAFFTWIFVAYGGYLAGLNLARLELDQANRLLALDWRAQLRGAFKSRPPEE